MRHKRSSMPAYTTWALRCSTRLIAESQKSVTPYIWYFCILQQAWLLWHLNDTVTASGGILTVEQKAKLDEARALVGRTQLPSRCKVCMHCHCCTMESHMLLCFMPLQCKVV